MLNLRLHTGKWLQSQLNNLLNYVISQPGYSGWKEETTLQFGKVEQLNQTHLWGEHDDRVQQERHDAACLAVFSPPEYRYGNVAGRVDTFRSCWHENDHQSWMINIR